MFSQSAHLYDAIYTRMKDYGEEARKVQAWIEKLRPGARTILDVACGTGEHAKYLAVQYGVDGIDLSPEFVAIAAHKNQAGRYVAADMRSFDLGRTYDVVLCLFSSIGYVRTLENLEKALRCFAAHTSPGGLILLEPWFTPEAWKPGRPHMVTVSEDELKVCRMNISETKGGGLSTMRFHYLVGTPEGVSHFTEDHELGLFTTDQMRSAFERAGLRVQYDKEGIFGRGLYIAEAPA